MSRPHLIFLMADQLRFDVLGPYGDTQCPTPKLDLLAERACVFERHFTNCPLCVPMRSSLMTGLHTHQHGAIINGWLPGERQYGLIRPDLPLLPQRLADAGYDVHHIGVQHVRSQPSLERRCPGVTFTGPASAGEHHRELTGRGLLLGDLSTFRDPVLEHDNGKPTIFAGTSPRAAVFPLREDLFYDCTLTQKMVQAIEEHEKSDKPLALLGMFWLPHPPLWGPRAWATLVPPDAVKLPPTVGHWYAGMPVMQLANVPGQLGAHVSMEQWRASWAVYLGMVALLDRCVGRVLAALDKAGLFDDALIVFTSDHGEMLGSHRLYQKMCLYDEAVRAPLLMKLPGQSRSRRVTELSDHLDLPATLLAAAEAPALENSTGRSLLPLAEGRHGEQPRAHVFAAYDGNAGRGYAHRMVRSTLYKFIHNIGDQPELYDLLEDPFETRNLAGTAELAAQEQSLRDALNAWMDSVGDPAPRA
jgi:arylsulfatase A-like enzyme